MSTHLETLSRPGGELKREPADRDEFDGLVRTAIARLRDAGNRQLSLESRFDLAYNAAHALCLAATRRLGYRPQKRYIVFQSLPHTLQLGPDVWRLLDRCHEKRNLAEYEGFLDVNETLVDELIAATQRVADALSQLPAPEPD